MNRLFTTFYIFPNFSCTFGAGISLSFKSGWPIWASERKLSAARCAMLKHPVHSLGSLFLFEHASHKFMWLSLNPINLWEIMKCMPCKVRGANVHGGCLKMLHRIKFRWSSIPNGSTKEDHGLQKPYSVTFDNVSKWLFNLADSLYEYLAIITRRNEVVAKVIFLHLFVILFTEGGSASVHAGIPPPPSLSRHPPEQTPPGTRHPPWADTPWDQTPTQSRAPPGADTPPGPDPPGKQTPAYGLRAASTHPTGMHSCFRVCVKGP